MTLKIDGKPIESVILPKLVLRIQQLLDASSPDELFTVVALAAKLDRSRGSIHDIATHPALDAYHIHVASYTYWGNPEAVEALRKERGL